MKHTFIFLLFLFGVVGSLHAQDKIILRNGSTREVKIHRTDDSHVYYSYPGEVSIYSQTKSAISHILYQDGRREIFDESLRTSERATTGRTPSTASGNRITPNAGIYWEDVKTTFMESDVRRLTRLQRISAISSVSYKDAIQELKKKAANIGGTIVLLMDIPEIELYDDIEVVGIAYRDENLAYVPRSTSERSRTIPAETASNERRRRIAQQMESYNTGSDFEDYSRTTPPPRTTTPSRQQERVEETSDAIYLLNGRVVRGTIQEFYPDDFVSIRTTTGRTYEYSMDDVRNIARGFSARSRQPAGRQSTAPQRSSRYDDSRYYDRYDQYSVSGYKGIFDVGYNFPIGGTGGKGSFEINTSHGFQVNEFLFAGAGLGLHFYNARDSSLKNTAASNTNFPQYMPTWRTDSTAYLRAVDSSYMTLPIFLDVRGYLPLQNSKISPFFMLRFGYAFNLSDGFSGMGIYMNPAVGAKFQLMPMLALNLSVGYAYQSYGGIPKNGGYGYYYYKDAAGKSSNTKYEAKGAGGISIKLGVEF
jgi:hypothetical protein